MGYGFKKLLSVKGFVFVRRKHPSYVVTRQNDLSCKNEYYYRKWILTNSLNLYYNFVFHKPAICSQGCYSSHGSCIAPDNCRCLSGWTGNNCAQGIQTSPGVQLCPEIYMTRTSFNTSFYLIYILYFPYFFIIDRTACVWERIRARDHFVWALYHKGINLIRVYFLT